MKRLTLVALLAVALLAWAAPAGAQVLVLADTLWQCGSTGTRTVGTYGWHHEM